MALVKGPLGPNSKGPSLSGSVVVDLYRGRIRVRKQPGSNSIRRSPAVQAHQEKFSQAQLLAKFVDDGSQWLARTYSKHSPFYWKDFLVSAMFGRLIELVIIDGEEWYSVALRDDVSKDIDIITGKQPWVMLARGADLWQALANPNSPAVLTHPGGDALPEWTAGSPGGGAIELIDHPSPQAGDREIRFPWPTGARGMRIHAYTRGTNNATNLVSFATEDAGITNYSHAGAYRNNLSNSSAQWLLWGQQTSFAPLFIQIDYFRDPINGSCMYFGHYTGCLTSGCPNMALVAGATREPQDPIINGIKWYAQVGTEAFETWRFSRYSIES